MRANWYDLLDVDPGASSAEVKAAWKSAIADLDPTDRRFRVFNQAAEVLLDDERRAAYDAELAAEAAADAELESESEPEPQPEPEPEPQVEQEPQPEQTVSLDKAPSAASADAEARPGTPARRPVPVLLLVALGVLALALAAGAVAVHLLRPSTDAVETAAEEAERAAQQAATIVFGYDHARMAADREAASALLTGDYRKDYEELFALLEENAPRLGTKVEVEFISSGVVRNGADDEADDRVQVFVAFDQLTTDKQRTEPARTAAYATLTMERVDGEWLVADVQGPPVQEAPDAGSESSPSTGEDEGDTPEQD